MQNNDELKFNFGCASCGCKEQAEHIDVMRVINKLDALFDKNDMIGAERVLAYWRAEAVRLGDKRGELSIVSEQLGCFRKTNEKDKGLEAASRALALIDELELCENVSSGTIFLNAATTMKAFGQAEQAMPIYEAAKALYDKHLDPNDACFAGFYNNYALALADLGRYLEAEDAYKKAVAIMEKVEQGKPDAAISCVNMAQLYGAMADKNDEDCMRCMKQALDLLQDKENQHNGYYYYVLSKCAPAYRDMGRDDVAEVFEKQVKEYYEGT